MLLVIKKCFPCLGKQASIYFYKVLARKLSANWGIDCFCLLGILILFCSWDLKMLSPKKSSMQFIKVLCKTKKASCLAIVCAAVVWWVFYLNYFAFNKWLDSSHFEVDYKIPNWILIAYLDLREASSRRCFHHWDVHWHPVCLSSVILLPEYLKQNSFCSTFAWDLKRSILGDKSHKRSVCLLGKVK